VFIHNYKCTSKYIRYCEICMESEIEGPEPRGRPKRTWREVAEKDCEAWSRRMLWIVVDGGVDKGCLMIRMGVSGWMFLLVPAHPSSSGPTAVKRLCVCECEVCILSKLFHYLHLHVLITISSTTNLLASCYFSSINSLTRSLRSGSQNLLALPTLSSEFGRHSFSYCAPSVWNKLPLSVWSLNSFNSFRSYLNTHLFARH